MDYFELIESRFSNRVFKSDKVEKEKLDKILDAARLAPTAKNLQAFKIVVFDTSTHGELLKKIYTREFLIQAPIVLGVFSKSKDSWVRGDGKNYADVDAAIVFDHIILAATALGLGTCWIGAFNAPLAKELINIGEDYEPIAFTPIGYSDASIVKKNRKSIEDLVVYY